MPGPIIRRIDHVVVLVHDVDSAFQTYTRCLGFPVSWEPERHAEGWQSAAVWLGNASLELLSPLHGATSADGSFFSRALEGRAEGLFLVAFEPGGFDRAVTALKARGVAITAPDTGSAERPARTFRTAFISNSFTPGLNAFLCEYDPPFSPLDGGKGALKVKKLDHIVIATEDLEDAAAKWERNLGLKPDASLDRPLGSGFKVARLPVGDAFLELVQPVAQTGRFAEQFRERGEGIFSVSIEVDDLEGAVAYLRGKGAAVSDPEPGIWPGSRVARLSHTSTHGVSMQLIERR